MFRITEEEFNSYNYPIEMANRTEGERVVMGNMGASTMNLIAYLLQEGVFECDESAYKIMVEKYSACFKERENLKIENLKAFFEDGIKALKLKAPKSVQVMMLGNDINGQGANDILTLFVHAQLIRFRVNYTVIASTQNLDFLLQYYQNGLIGEAADSNRSFKSLSGSLKQSENLRRWEPHLNTVINGDVQNSYIGHMKLLAFDYPKEGGIILYAHRPVHPLQIKTLFILLQQFLNEPDKKFKANTPKEFGESINQMNDWFRRVLQTPQLFIALMGDKSGTFYRFVSTGEPPHMENVEADVGDFPVRVYYGNAEKLSSYGERFKNWKAVELDATKKDKGSENEKVSDNDENNIFTYKSFVGKINETIPVKILDNRQDSQSSQGVTSSAGVDDDNDSGSSESENDLYEIELEDEFDSDLEDSELLKNLQLKSEDCDIYQYPTNIAIRNPNERVTIADLDGNAIKLQAFLIKEGVFTFTDQSRAVENYNKLIEIYKSAHQQTLTLQQVSEYKNIIGVCVESDPDKNTHVLILGDDLCDRGASDLLTILEYFHLSELGVNYNIIASNHGLDFLLQFFSEGGLTGPSVSVYLSSETENGDAYFGRSLKGLRDFLSNSDPKHQTYHESIKEFIKDEYLKHLQLLAYDFREDGIVLYTHAPVHPVQIKKLYDMLKTELNDPDKEFHAQTPLEFAESIEQINTWFQGVLNDPALFTRLMQPEATLHDFVNSRYDTLFSFEDSGPENDAILASFGNFPVWHNHGHMGETPIKVQQAVEMWNHINNDTCQGKRGMDGDENSVGQFVSFVTKVKTIEYNPEVASTIVDTLEAHLDRLDQSVNNASDSGGGTQGTKRHANPEGSPSTKRHGFFSSTSNDDDGPPTPSSGKTPTND